MALDDFATHAHPLRASALPLLVRCPMRAVLMFLDEIHGASGEAADTGSAVHAAVEYWHQTGKLDGAIAYARSRADRFPKADWDEVRLHFTPYADDPRNTPKSVAYSELKVEFSIRPAASDPTQRPIIIRGTLDQLRRTERGLELWDVKTGKRAGGWVMLHEHALQLAAYTAGASRLFPEPLVPGGVIRTYGYRVRNAALPSPNGVFFHAAWGSDDCELLLDSVRAAVARIRAGDVEFGPGEHCEYCPAQGLENCIPLARRWMR